MRELIGLVPTVAELIDAPALGLRLAPEAAAAMLAKLEGAAAVLRARLAAPSTNGAQAEPETWLDAPAVAARLGVSVKAIYSRRGLPWSRCLGRTKRMAASDLESYLKGKRR